MSFPEGNSPKPSLAKAKNDLETIDRKIEVADANENVIERTQALDTLWEERDLLIAEIRGVSQYNDEQD